MKLRNIVIDAYKVDELKYQFEQGDCVEQQEVNEFYPHRYILKEAYYRVGYVSEAMREIAHYPSDDPQLVAWKKAKKELKDFLLKWDQPNMYAQENHPNENLRFEQIFELIEKKRGE